MVLKLLNRVVERSQGFLEPGEQVRRVVVAQGGINPWAQVAFCVAGFLVARIVATVGGSDSGLGVVWGAVGGLAGAVVVSAFIRRRVVLRTDRGVVVLEYGRFGAVKPTRVLARLPLETGIGPLSGTWARIELAGERLWVHKKWHGDAAAFTPTRLG